MFRPPYSGHGLAVYDVIFRLFQCFSDKFGLYFCFFNTLTETVSPVSHFSFVLFFNPASGFKPFLPSVSR